MASVKELRFTFLCPDKGTITFGTQLSAIKNGKAQVACQVCGGTHDIEPAEPSEDEGVDVEKLIESANFMLIGIRSNVDDIENMASEIESSTVEAQGLLSNAIKTLENRAPAGQEK